MTELKQKTALDCNICSAADRTEIKSNSMQIKMRSYAYSIRIKPGQKALFPPSGSLSSVSLPDLHIGLYISTGVKERGKGSWN